jgi:hypothetical protein
MTDPIRFGHPMRDWQRECAAQSRGIRFMVMALHRRAGKTELALKKLCDAATKNTMDLPNYFYLAPFLKQAKAIAWQRLRQMVSIPQSLGACEINESDLSVKFKHNGAVIRLFGADNPDAMRGVRLDGAVIDEVAQIKPGVWDDIIQPALSDRKGWAWFIGTPQGVNLFSQLFYDAKSKPQWGSALYTVHDTQAIDPEEVTRLERDMSETSFAREYLCDFSAAGDDQLISLSDAEVASRRVYGNKDIYHAPIVLGVDPARFGDDRSVIVMRQGLVAFKPDVYRGIDNMELAARVAYKIEEVRPDAVFIDSGAGAGVIDRLRQLWHDVIEVPFGGKANRSDLYTNRRTEMWFELRDWLRAGGGIPNDVSLKQELATPTFGYDNQGRRALESKDEIKKRLQGGASPDMADALALTFAAFVGKKTPLQQLEVRRERRDYDPYR